MEGKRKKGERGREREGKREATWTDRFFLFIGLSFNAVFYFFCLLGIFKESYNDFKRERLKKLTQVK